MNITRKNKDEYICEVYSEMERRGFKAEEIPIIIGKTGFLAAVEEYPDVQLCIDIADAVDEILMTAEVYKKTNENN